MRNRLRVAMFDIMAPVGALAALGFIGVVLAWPVWWVSVFSVLSVLFVEAMAVNFWLARRDAVTVGTDDDGPGVRLAVVAVATAAVVAAVAVGYTRWTLPDHELASDTSEVLGIASSVAEASATFTPQNPTASIDRASALMAPDRAETFKSQFADAAKQLTSKNVSAQASMVSEGVEAIGRTEASVAVILRGSQSTPGKAPETAVLALRVQLTKQDGRWLVQDVTPIHSR